MLKTNMEFKGGRDLEAKLGLLADPKTADRLGNASVRKGAKHLESAILARAPVGTASTKRRFRTKSGKSYTKDYGRITTQIRVTKARAKIAVHDVEYSITRGSAFWAKMVEFGTVKMAAQPFVRPAVDAEEVATVRIIGDDLGQRIERTFKRRGIVLD